MSDPLARYSGENGVRVEVRDETRTYAYADVFRVRLRVTAAVPGQEAAYERDLERLGVRAEDLPRVRAELLDDFRRHTLPYLLHPAFPRRWAEHLGRARPRVIPFPGAA